MIATLNNALAKKRDENEKGFTLIELLVVILIIGVLAAIAIPAFLNQRQGAWESQVKSDIANAVIAAESYAVSNNGSYAGLDVAKLTASGYNPTPDVLLTVSTGASASEFVFVVTHSQYTGQTWTFTHSTGKTVKS